MKSIFIIFILITALFCGINPSYAQDVNINNTKLAYDQTYQIRQTLRKIDMEINKNYREIQRIKRSNSLSNNEKEIKIRKLKREINSKEREAQKLKQKCRRIIS